MMKFLPGKFPGLDVMFGRKVPETILIDFNSDATETVHRYPWEFRCVWGQVALWHNYKAIFDFRNPLVWRDRYHLRHPPYPTEVA